VQSLEAFHEDLDRFWLNYLEPPFFCSPSAIRLSSSVLAVRMQFVGLRLDSLVWVVSAIALPALSA
jgi:hypothetical protein